MNILIWMLVVYSKVVYATDHADVFHTVITSEAQLDLINRTANETEPKPALIELMREFFIIENKNQPEGCESKLNGSDEVSPDVTG